MRAAGMILAGGSSYRIKSRHVGDDHGAKIVVESDERYAMQQKEELISILTGGMIYDNYRRKSQKNRKRG